jgi:uncharacterized protein YbjT (DUF2867 family)
VLNMVKTTLATGATGNVGSEVVKQLLASLSGHRVKTAIHSQNKVDKFRNGRNSVRQRLCTGVQVIAVIADRQKVVAN